MRHIKEFITEAKDTQKFLIYGRIISKTPYANFLFANNMICKVPFDYETRETTYNEIIKRAMSRLEKFHPIFREFDTPVLTLPNSPRSGVPKATSELDGYTLELTIVSYMEGKAVGVDDNISNINAPVFKESTQFWSETKKEHKLRLESFEKSEFNEYCIDMTNKPFKVK